MSMLVYPQFSQYPVKKTRRARTVMNEAADGTTVRLSDPAGETTEWQLDYTEISDEEAAAIEQLFEAAEGSLQGFTFLDPSANLLAWTERMDNEVWQKDPMLTVTQGTERGWRLVNAGAAEQGVAQTLQVPGGYTYCFSVYARSAGPATVRLTIGERSVERVVSDGWGRIVFAASGAASAESLRFGVEVPAGATVDVWGPQVEAQGGASVYRTSTRGGVYADAHFRDDVFQMTRSGFNRNSCTVNIIHADDL